MKSLRRVLFIIVRGFGVFLEVLFGCIGVYLLLTTILSRITVAPEKTAVADVTIYITSNGVHTDFVVPIITEYRDWGKELKLTREFRQDTTRKWIAIGWGDKNFFLKTKSWGDLTAATALKAVFGLGTGAVHIVQRSEPALDSPDVFSINMSEDQYKRLLSYIDQSFVRNGENLSRIYDHPYSEFDFFFDSVESYSMAFTCNSWTNKGLKASGQKACLWTAFKGGIFVQYGK